jgi:hypothetical protein
MYSNKFVAVIKANGRVLRENNGTVAVPFGSEYSILLKNLNSVRVMAKISIDGQDATEGTWLVLGANTNSEIERFIKNGNLSAGNRFKFIERSPAVEAHRGIGAEDGLVRIEFKTEKVWAPPPPPIFQPSYQPWPRPGRRSTDSFGTRSLGGTRLRASGGISGQSVNSVHTSYHTANSTVTGSLDEASVDDVVAGGGGAAAAAPSSEPAPAGITVQGGVSNQHFQWTDSFPVHEPGEVIVLRLVGAIDGHQVTQPVTVEQKPTCTTCGRVNRATNKFCAQCGTSLTLI